MSKLATCICLNLNGIKKVRYTILIIHKTLPWERFYIDWTWGYVGYGPYGNLRWKALFEVKVVDTDAPSHHTRSPEAILESGAKEKKRIYEQAVVEWRGNFTSIVLLVDGLLHREAEHFLKRMGMAANLAHKWKPYSQACGYVQLGPDWPLLS